MVRGMVARRDVVSSIMISSWWFIGALLWVTIGTAMAEYGLARSFEWKGTYPTIVVAWPIALVMAFWFVYQHNRERRRGR